MNKFKHIFNILRMKIGDDTNRQCSKNVAMSVIVCISAGTACQSEYKDMTPEGLYQAADMLMYEDKSAFYNNTGHDRRHRG